MLEIKCLALGQLETNCYIINSNDNADRKAVIIDPADDFEIIDDYLTSKSLTPLHIILTHAHFDHMGALNALSEKYNPEIIVHENDANLAKNPSLNLSVTFGGKPLIINSDKIRTVIEEYDTLLGHKFSYISTPGHTPGSMCVMTENVIFTGDTLFYRSIGNAFPPYGDTVLEMSSIKTKLFSLEDDYVCYPGHGQQTTLQYEKKNNPYVGDISIGY